MDLVDEYLDYIAQKTTYIIGEDLFPETFPDTPDFAIVLNLQEGPRELDNACKQNLYITVRSDPVRRVDASTICRDLLTVLNGTQVTLGLGKVMWSNVKQGCRQILVDPSSRYYYQGLLLIHFAYNNTIGGNYGSS